MAKRVFCILFFIVLICASLFLADRILVLKNSDGPESMLSFYYQPENSIDVLLMGSSNTGINLDVEVLWTEYGISAYALWGSSQPFWNTYYYLEESFKTQHPQVVVLDVFAAKVTDEYLAEIHQYNNIIGMRRNKNRLHAAKESAKEEQWMDLFLGFPLYHSRLSELTEEDFHFFPWSEGRINHKGTSVRYGTYPDHGSISMVYDDSIGQTEMIEKESFWLKKIALLCKTKGVQLVLIKTPVSDRDIHGSYYRGVASLAESLELPYLDMNNVDAETGIQSSDFWLDLHHLNTTGARKTTRYLASYLKAHYILEDHRGDAAYKSWDAFSHEMQNKYLAQITEKQDLLMELCRNTRTVFLIRYGGDEDAHAVMSAFSEAVSIGGDVDYSEDGLYVCGWRNDTSSPVMFEPFRNGYLDIKIGDTGINGGFETGTGIAINNTMVYRYRLMDPTVLAIIYDTEENKVLSVCSFRESNAWQMERMEVSQ